MFSAYLYSGTGEGADDEDLGNYRYLHGMRVLRLVRACAGIYRALCVGEGFRAEEGGRVSYGDGIVRRNDILGRNRQDLDCHESDVCGVWDAWSRIVGDRDPVFL